MKRGKGIWRLNTSVLKEKMYIDKVEEIISKVNVEFMDLPASLKLEITKIRVKEFTIAYTQERARNRRNEIIVLEKKLTALDKLIDENLSEGVLNEFSQVKNRLEELYKENARGAQISRPCKMD